jgi:hypothetical protein
MLKNTATTNASGGTRRPPNNPDVPKTFLDMLNHDLNAIKEMLDTFAQHLRALDRKRLNGVGIKKLGFIRRTERGRGRACTDMFLNRARRAKVPLLTERVRTRRA